MGMWKEAGIKVIPVVASVAQARLMEKSGADAVVAEGMAVSYTHLRGDFFPGSGVPECGGGCTGSYRGETCGGV